MKHLVMAFSIVLCSSAMAQGRPEVLEATGDLSHEYSFDLPPARGRFQPRLFLTYASSSKSNEGVGYGWTLSNWYIEKDLTSSPPAGDPAALGPDRGYYWFVDGNGRTLLVPTATPGTYRPYVEKAYLAVSYDANLDQFEATDGQGTIYRFERPTRAMKVMSRWYLSKVQDLDGNITAFRYAPVTCSGDGGQGGLCTTNWLQSIGYNVDSSGAFATTVRIIWKPDANAGYTSSESGLLRMHDMRLWRVTASGPTGTSNHQLCYSSDDATCLAETSQATGLLPSEQGVAWRPRLLRRATRFGGQIADTQSLSTSGVLALPPTQFNYAGEALSDVVGWGGATETPQPVVTSTVPVGVGGADISRFPQFVDMDGDGKPDLIWGPGNSLEQVLGPPGWSIMDQGSLFWARNVTPVGATILSFDGPQKLLSQTGIFDWTRSWGFLGFGTVFPLNTRSMLRDFDGDGIPDLVRIYRPTDLVDLTLLQVCLVKASPPTRVPVAAGTDPVVSSPLEVTSCSGAFVAPGTGLDSWGTVIVDINGDGIPDITRASLHSDDAGVYPPDDACVAPIGDTACAYCSTWVWKVFLGGWLTNGGLAFTYWGELPVVPGGTSRRYRGSHLGGVACLTPESQIRPLSHVAGVDLNRDGLLDSVEFASGWSIAPWPGPLVELAAWGSASWGSASSFVVMPSWGRSDTGAAPNDTGAHPFYSGLWGTRMVSNPDDPKERLPEDCQTGGEATGLFLGLYLDVNGDGLADEVMSGGAGSISVNWGNGFEFVPGATATLLDNPYFPDLYPFMSTPEDTVVVGSGGCRAPDRNAGIYGLMTDLNGDGVADYVIHGGRWRTDGTPLRARPGPIMFYPGARQAGALPNPYLLTEVVTPERAHWSVTYGLSTLLPGGPPSVRPVVTSVSVSGDHVKSNTVRYTYANWRKQDSWVQTGSGGTGGFSESWSLDGATGLSRQTRWTTGSPALPGRPIMVMSGIALGWEAGTPAMSTVFEKTTSEWSLRDSAGNCHPPEWLDATTDLAPLHVFAAAISSKSAADSLIGFAQVDTSVACADVDANGNVLKSVVTPSFVTHGPFSGVHFAGKRLTTTVTRVASGTSQCPNVPDAIRTTKSDDWGAELLVEGVDYDQKCHPTRRYSIDRSKSPWDPLRQTNLTKTTYTTFGRVQTIVSSDVTPSQGTDAVEVVKTLEYDGDSPIVKRELLSDAVRTLATVYQWDHSRGLKMSQSGPAVMDGTGALIDPIQRYYAYDEAGRELGVSKVPFNGATSSQVVQVTEYDDGASPRAIRGFRFSQPKSLTLGGTAWQQDAGTMLSVAYFDEVGRQIQARERLGAGTTSPTNEGGRVTVGLTGWRVVKAVSYDAAGRESAVLEPFYSNTGAFQDLSQPSSLPAGQIVRATLNSFDARGRMSCSTVAPISDTLPASPPQACVSDFAEGATSRLATEFRYDWRLVPTRGPYQGWFATTEVVPPEQTANGKSHVGVVKLSGPLGEELGSIDADGNRLWIERDALQREIGSWRESASGAERTPQMASTISYNTAGQVIETWDMNSPTIWRKFVYDRWGRVVNRVLDSNTGDGVGYEFGQGQLGRVTSQTDSKAVFQPADLFNPSGGWWTMSSTVVATYLYDEPASLVVGSQCAAASAPGAPRYVAGKLSLMAVPSKTSIAYSYDDAGRINCRDQRFDAIDSGQRLFTVTSDYGADGRVLQAKYGAGAQGALTQSVDYDSAGRPVMISGVLGAQASTNYWEAVAQGGTVGVTGAYDALGRIGVMHADGGAAASVRAYSAYTGQLTDEWKSFTGSGTIIHQVTGTTYEGSKVAAYRDDLAQTNYSNTYWPSGKLSRAVAATSGAPGPLSQGYDFAYVFNGIGNLFSASETVSLPAASSTVSTYDPVTTAAGEFTDAFNVVRHSAGSGGAVALPLAEETSYTYDVRGNLTAVARNGVVAEQLAYGPAGELLYRQVGEQFVFYVGEYMTVRASGATGCASNGTCAPLSATVEADYHVLLAATRIVSVSPSRTLYYYRSRLGTVVATSLAGGVLGAQYRYDPYGKLQVALNETAATASEYGYTNALRLTGDLWHLKARVYDAAGRVFLQSDSVDRYRYAYVWGDPQT